MGTVRKWLVSHRVQVRKYLEEKHPAENTTTHSGSSYIESMMPLRPFISVLCHYRIAINLLCIKNNQKYCISRLFSTVLCTEADPTGFYVLLEPGSGGDFSFKPKIELCETEGFYNFSSITDNCLVIY